jgi:DNA-binding transcriptional ArsR family regulator
VIARALSHPLRARLLAAFNEKTASPSDLARELDESLGNVSYHVRILLSLDCIELVRTGQVRGAIEHHYRARVPVALPRSALKSLPANLKRALAAQGVSGLLDDLVQSGSSGALGEGDPYLARASFELDEDSRGEVQEVLSDALDRVKAIARRGAKGRGAAADGDGVSVATEIAVLHFPRGKQR